MQRIDVGYKEVKCRSCKKEYTCTPANDYYNFTTTEDGVCEFCLITEAGLDPNNVVEVDAEGNVLNEK